MNREMPNMEGGVFSIEGNQKFPGYGDCRPEGKKKRRPPPNAKEKKASCQKIDQKREGCQERGKVRGEKAGTQKTLLAESG